MKYPNRLAEARAERKMTQEDVVFQLRKNGVELSIRHYARFESGDYIPDLKLSRAIAEVLDTTLEDLWEDDE